jgi:hypothetical protein
MKILVIVAVCSLVFIFGCYTPHFLPNTAPTPLFEKAGDVRISGYAGTNSYDAQFSLSPAQHAGIVAAYSNSVSSKKDKDVPEADAEYSHGHKYFEGALGYYFDPIPFRKDVMKFEMFVGYGQGTTTGSLDQGKKSRLGFLVPTTQVDADYTQYYVQLNTAVSETYQSSEDPKSEKGTMEYGSLMRLSRTEISNYSRLGQSLNVPSPASTFFQIGAFGRVGSELSFTFQAGWLFILSDPTNATAYSPFYLTVGVGLALGK